MKKLLVLGIGNRLMMDDGVGLHVVEALKRKDDEDERVEYIVGESDMDYCLSVIEGRDMLIIVDAVLTGKNPGEITLFPVQNFEVPGQGISAHNLHLFHMIPLMYPGVSGTVIGIEAGRIDFGMELSEELKERLDDVIAGVGQIISRFITNAYLF